MLTIGEFSRLGRISARMLRYYDAIGLLRPEYVAENGYRFYDQRQLADMENSTASGLFCARWKRIFCEWRTKRLCRKTTM